MSDQLVVARFRGGDQSAPRFTRTSTIDELLNEVEARIPVDIVYFLLPHPDGKGYSFREAGLITIDIKELIRTELQRQVAQPSQPTPPSPQETSDIPELDEGMIPVNPATPEGYAFEHTIKPDKTQQEELAARGLEIAPEAPGKKKRIKKVKPAPSITEKDLDDGKPLPHPVSIGGNRQVTSISQATQAEQTAASRQIFR